MDHTETFEYIDRFHQEALFGEVSVLLGKLIKSQYHMLQAAILPPMLQLSQPDDESFD